MTTYRFGRFEVHGAAELLRTVAGSTFLIGAGEPLFSLIARMAPRSTAQGLAKTWARAARRFLEIDEDVDGLQFIDVDESYVVAPLHEGFADALMLALLPVPLRYVVRDELLEWAQLGRALRATDQIRVTPENRVTGLRQLMVEAERTFHRGESLVIFPQGSILGVEARFSSGAFRIADRLGLRLLPVVITGTHRVWEHPYSDRLRFGQKASLRVLEPIEPGEALASMRSVERRMKTIAESDSTAPARHFDPARDGFWDGYAYEIDPAYPDVARQVEAHRSRGLD